MKTLGKASLTILALGTAYGLGILSCVVYGVKLFCEACEATKKESSNK